ncbi:MAG: carbohydrate porin [Methyloceanibacter sp.]
MTIRQIALCDLARQLSSIGRLGSNCLKALGAGLLLAIVMSLSPNAAEADCQVTDTGIPDDVAFRLDVAGARHALANSGIALSGAYYGESFGNWGGFKQGVTYDGLLDVHLDADMKKLGLWKGLCFHTNAYQIHGQSITADNILSLMPVSNIEATPATRLDELWFEQHMFNDRLAVKVGQLAADNDFILSDAWPYFLNGTWGWPSITASDLPSGGPAYPLATPGVLTTVTPSDKLSLLVGVYNGDPSSRCSSSDPQICNNDGLDFSLDSPPLLMVEGAYKYNQAQPLPGTLKLGGWNHFGTFEDLRFSSGRLPIAETGNPGRLLDNDWGFYGIIDQLVWRVPGSKDPKGVGVFARVIGAPSDRNVVDFYADGGVTFTGMIPGHSADALAIGFAYTGISSEAHGLDIDLDQPVARNYEALIEICYTYQIKPGWTVQPDFQYFFQPGGNVPDADGNGAVENAAVLGARTTISF